MRIAPISLALMTIGAVALLGRKSAASVVPTPTPQPNPGGTPPTPTPQPNPGGTTPTHTGYTGGRAFVASLPELAGPRRDQMVLEAVRAGFMPPITWYQVDCSRDGVEAFCWVTGDCLAVGTDGDFVRVNVGNDTAQKAADLLGCLLPTSRIDDLAWKQRTVSLGIHNQTPDAQMANTSRMVRHHDEIERDRQGRTGLVRPLGKAYYLSRKMVPAYIWFGGWHSPSAPYKSPDGVPVLQPSATGNHEVSYADYSHHPTFVHRDCVVRGQKRDLAEVLGGPDAIFFSAEGPCPTRHPSVPNPEAPGVLV